VPWADEAEKQLPTQAPSDYQLSAYVPIFAADLRQELGRHQFHSKATFDV